MKKYALHVCECPRCKSSLTHPDRQRHWQINLLLSRMDEQQRRWFAAFQLDWYDSISLVAKITGLDTKTIRRGQVELKNGLAGRPPGRVRLPRKNSLN